MGTFLFYLLWPLVWLYAPLRVRVRAIVRCQNEMLVVKNWFGSGAWQLPGGGTKLGEEPAQTALRELQEELGLNLAGQPAKQLTAEPRVVKQSGLLLRYHYVLIDVDAKPAAIQNSKAIRAWQWRALDAAASHELKTAAELLR